MNRWNVVLKSSTGTRTVTVAANDMIAARIAADQQHRKHGEQIVSAKPYGNIITCR